LVETEKAVRQELRKKLQRKRGVNDSQKGAKEEARSPSIPVSSKKKNQTLKKKKLKPLTSPVVRLWGHAPSAQAQFMKMACAMSAKTILAQINPATSKLARSSCSRKFLLNKFKSY
jgi:hypothetical protein